MKKNTTKKASTQTGAKKTTSKKTASASRKTSTKKAGRTASKTSKSLDELNEYNDRMAFENGITIIVMFILSAFLYLCFFNLCSSLGIIISGLIFGIFGWIAWILPIYFIFGYLLKLANPNNKRVLRKLISSAVFIVSLECIIQLATDSEVLNEYYTSNHVLHHNFFQCLYMSFEDITQRGRGNGGMICKFIVNLLSSAIGQPGTALVFIALILISIYFFFGVEYISSLRKKNAYKREMEQAIVNKRQDDDYEDPRYIPYKRTNRRLDNRLTDYNTDDTNQAGAYNTYTDNQPVNHKMPSFFKLTRADDSKKVAEDASSQTSDNEIKEIKPDDSTQLKVPVYIDEMKNKFGQGQSEESEQLIDDNIKINEFVDTAAETVVSSEMNEITSDDDDFLDADSTVDTKAAASTKEIPAANVPPKNPSPKKRTSSVARKTDIQKPASDNDTFSADTTVIPVSDYKFPPLDLLSSPTNNNVSQDRKQLTATAQKLVDTLKSFGVAVEMGEITCGPTVTRFEILPKHGVRVNRITNLVDDIKLSLAASNIRIEAPIPGKSAVGIEVPNTAASTVFFKDLILDKSFETAKSNVTFAVGKDIYGKVILADISKMPHLLIAGATGSGKSVCINTLIMSILYKSSPDDVKLIMIDPKVVELSVYNGIPHLLCPVVTDAKQAAASLNWAVSEMMGRYNKLKELGVRNINGYNEKIEKMPDAEKAGYSKMPLLVIIVDEFADLMMVASKEVEDAVCRLTQLARACGIHLILATQRPSVNVITGLIKANMPSRIAFSVSSAIDSRTILDKSGAEGLIGKGDMLFFPAGYSEPVRIQGAFISDSDVSNVTDFLRKENEEPVYNNSVTQVVEAPSESDSQDNDDEMFDEHFNDAAILVIEADRASAGQLQRRFRIGFNRAGRIIDQLYEAGVVGQSEGTKPRKVLMSLEEFKANFMTSDEDASNQEDVDEDYQEDVPDLEDTEMPFDEDED